MTSDAFIRQRELRRELESVEYWLQRERALLGKDLPEYQSRAGELHRQLLDVDSAVVRLWLDEYVVMSEASGQLLGLAGNRVRRRTASQAFLRGLGLPDEVRDSTLALVHSHVDRIVELTRLRQRLRLTWYLPFVAAARPGNLVQDSDRWTARALNDFGWVHEHVPFPVTAEAIDRAIADAYHNEMTRRILPILRKLSNAGWLVIVD